MASEGSIQNIISDKAGMSPTPAAVPTPKDDIKYTIPQPSHPDGPRLTMYSYDPQWPREGEWQRLVGPIAGSREAALKIAKEGFPSLQEVPDKQIRFAIRPRSDLNYDGPRLVIVDGAWASMPGSTARSIYVTVEESPEVLRQRKARRTQTIKTVVGNIAKGAVVVAGLSWAYSYQFM